MFFFGLVLVSYAVPRKYLDDHLCIGEGSRGTVIYWEPIQRVRLKGKLGAGFCFVFVVFFCRETYCWLRAGADCCQTTRVITSSQGFCVIDYERQCRFEKTILQFVWVCAKVFMSDGIIVDWVWVCSHVLFVERGKFSAKGITTG